MDVVVAGPPSAAAAAVTVGLLAAGHHVREGRTISAELPQGCTVVSTGPLDHRAVGGSRGIRHLVAVAVAPVIPGAQASPDEAALSTATGTGLGWSLLRSTVPHQALEAWLERAAARPATVVPEGIRHQPVDAAALVRRVVAIVAAGPAGCVPVLAGPEIHTLSTLAAQWSEIRGRLVRLIQVAPQDPLDSTTEAVHPDRALPGLTWRQHLTRAAAPTLSAPPPLDLH